MLERGSLGGRSGRIITAGGESERYKGYDFLINIITRNVQIY
jgi:hypothetical protein